MCNRRRLVDSASYLSRLKFLSSFSGVCVFALLKHASIPGSSALKRPGAVSVCRHQHAVFLSLPQAPLRFSLLRSHRPPSQPRNRLRLLPSLPRPPRGNLCRAASSVSLLQRDDLPRCGKLAFRSFPRRVPISLISRADGGLETPCRLRSPR
jgi:hypothetical protein